MDCCEVFLLAKMSVNVYYIDWSNFPKAWSIFLCMDELISVLQMFWILKFLNVKFIFVVLVCNKISFDFMMHL
jgi:hypothetical protein